MSFAAAHLDRLVSCDRTLYARACAIVRHAAAAWGCSLDALIEPGKAPEIDQVRAALTVVIREQTCLSQADIALVLNREDPSCIAYRVRTARAALFRRLDPVFSAYWSLIRYLRGRFVLQGNAAMGEHPFESSASIDLKVYLTRPAGLLDARAIREGVAKALGIGIDELLRTSSRPRESSDARAISFVLMRITLDLSYPQIARAMNMKTHSTVIGAANRLAERVDAGDDDLRVKLTRCAEALNIDLPESPLAAQLQRASSPSAAPDTPARKEFAGPRTGASAPAVRRSEGASDRTDENHELKTDASRRAKARREAL